MARLATSAAHFCQRLQELYPQKLHFTQKQSEQSSPFRRWTTNHGPGSSCRHPDHRNMYNKSCVSGEGAGGGGGGGEGGPARWALGLEHLLADPAGARAFAHFLQQEYAAENIRFWWACEQYRAADAATRAQLAGEIFARHLADAAPEPVNVDCAARRAAATLLASSAAPAAPPPDAFSQAQKQIFTVLKLDSYPRFLRSNIHAECARADLSGRPSIYQEDNDMTKLKKSASNASERRRSGGASLLPWKLRANSKDRSAASDQAAAPDVVKSSGAGSGLCRVQLPDGATSVVGVGGAGGAGGGAGPGGGPSVRQLLDRLLQRRNLPTRTYDVIFNDDVEDGSGAVQLWWAAARLAGREVRVEPRVLVRLQLGDKCVAVRCRPTRRLRHILPVVAARYCAGGPQTAALRGGRPLPPDTLMQELDGSRLTVVEVCGDEFRAPPLLPRPPDAASDADALDVMSNSSDHSIASSTTGSNGNNLMLTSTTAVTNATNMGSNGTSVGSNGTSLGTNETSETSTGSNGRVRATLRPGPMHHHPPEFLEKLRNEQRARLLGRRSPPPLPPKPPQKMPAAV